MGHKNEVGLEYSFFNIEDAHKIIQSQVNDYVAVSSICKTLSLCQSKVQQLLEQQFCDELGAVYLENIVYQIVRDSLGPNKVFSLAKVLPDDFLKQMPDIVYQEVQELVRQIKDYKQISTNASMLFQPISQEQDFAKERRSPDIPKSCHSSESGNLQIRNQR